MSKTLDDILDGRHGSGGTGGTGGATGVTGGHTTGGDGRHGSAGTGETGGGAAGVTGGTVETGGGVPWGDGSFLDWYMRDLGEGRKHDEQRLAEEERRLKRNKLFATIGDGLGAMHEAYSKARGVPPMTDGISLSQKWQSRYDKLQAERDASKQRYLTGYLHLMKEQRAADLAEQNAEYKRETLSLRRQKEQNSREMNNARLKYWDAKAKGETDKAEYYSKLYELVSNGMSEQDARVALGIEPKTTYTVSDKHDSSGKTSVTVTARTGDAAEANHAIDRANGSLGRHGSGGTVETGGGAAGVSGGTTTGGDGRHGSGGTGATSGGSGRSSDKKRESSGKKKNPMSASGKSSSSGGSTSTKSGKKKNPMS